MKRPLLLLALPLVLAALMFGVKWRADHPTPTKDALEMRALLLQASRIEVSHVLRRPPKGYIPLKMQLSAQEMKPLSERFYLSPPSEALGVQTGRRGVIQIHCWLAKPRKDGVVGVFINIGVDKREGRAGLGHWPRFDEHTLHPVTVKQWLELLLTNPRIGPKLRARLKP